MLDPTRDKPMPSDKDTHKEKLQKTLLPDERCTRLCREPANIAICLLTARVYLKLKKCVFNEVTQVEVAAKFDVKIKTLSNVLSGNVTEAAKTDKLQQKEKASLHLQQSSHQRRWRANPKRKERDSNQQQ